MQLTKTLLHTTETYIKSLAKSGVCSVQDLIQHYPRDYEDRTNVLENFSMIHLKEKNTILVKMLTVDTHRTGNGKLLTKAVFEDKNGFLAEAIWFNRKYLGMQLEKSANKKVLVSGKVKYDFGKVVFQSPEVETDLSKLSGEIVPIYPDIHYIPGRWIADKMKYLQQYFQNITETLPLHILEKYNFISRSEALQKLHFPKTLDDVALAKSRLAYEELYHIHHTALLKKHQNYTKSEGKSVSIPLNPDLIVDIQKQLPFELTEHQKITLFQVLKDMEKSHSMQRLLEGDVGTGKTVVAFIAALHGIIETQKKGNKIQVAMMAPTEILARQHFVGIQSLLEIYGIKSRFLVGSTPLKEKKEIKKLLKLGEIDIVIGTHALIQEDMVFANLGFVVIDEQHRFGVKQREILEQGFGNKSLVVPHNLNMTATPIPRTLALTLYGDQDLSIISQYPKGRKPIYTKVIKNQQEREQVEIFVRSEIEKGRQVFWISPLVEQSEKIDLANAIKTYESLCDIFHPFRTGLLHGRMKAKEKEQIMQEFKENNIQILSSTSVVEVGVDVPNATIMCIEGAQRFGLSQLHQFRGRVGRGQYQSHCFLFPTDGNPTARLRAMEKTGNGFELAEIDLELRGPGEVYGVRQSGLPDLKIADVKDLEMVSQIREDIEQEIQKSQ